MVSRLMLFCLCFACSLQITSTVRYQANRRFEETDRLLYCDTMTACRLVLRDQANRRFEDITDTTTLTMYCNAAGEILSLRDDDRRVYGMFVASRVWPLLPPDCVLH